MTLPDIRPANTALRTAEGEIVDPQTEAMAKLKAAQEIGVGMLVDPELPQITALKAAQAAGVPLKVDPLPDALATLRQG